MKKIFIVLFLCVLFFGMFCTYSFASDNNTNEDLKGSIVLLIDSPNAFVNGGVIKIDKNNLNVTPIIVNGQTLLPVRFISEKFGAEVSIKNNSQITVEKANSKIKISISSNVMDINGDQIIIDTPAKIINGRTFIPLRALSESLGKKVFWDRSGIIIIGDNELGFSKDIMNEIIDRMVEKLELRGNTTGNIINAAIAAKDEDWIYYRNYIDSSKIYKIKFDGNGKTKVTDIGGEVINVLGDYIYFMDFSGIIYKVGTNGYGLTKLNSDESGCISVVGKWIYYINISDKNKLYKIDTDGKNRTKLSDRYFNNINVLGNWIYFTNEESEICKIKTNGEEFTKVREADSTFLIVSDGWIYFDDSEHIYKMKFDGSENICLIDGIGNYNVQSNTMYIGCDWGLYKLDINKNVLTQLYDGYANIMNVVGEWIYYMAPDAGIMRIKNDGTELIEVIC